MNKLRIDEKNHSEISVRDLVFILIVLIAVTIRMISAWTTPVNAYEAAILNTINSRGSTAIHRGSLLEMMLIKSAFILFGPSKMGARLWPVLAGSGLVLITYILRNKIGWKLAFIFGILFAFEPFMLANSTQIGSNIFGIFGLACLIAAIVVKNKAFLSAGLVIILFSGRGLLPVSIALAAICVPLVMWDKKLLEHKLQFLKGLKKKELLQWGLSSVIGISIVVFIFGLDLGSVLSSFSTYYPKLQPDFFRYAPISGLPVVLLSYSPLVFFVFITAFRTSWKTERKFAAVSLLLILSMSFWLVTAPGRNYLDLVWVVIPMMVICGKFIGDLSLPSQWRFADTIILLITLVMQISLLLSISEFVQLGRNGLSQGGALINMVTVIFLFVASFFILRSIDVELKIIKGIRVAILVALMLIQAAFIFRSGGFSGHGAQEVLLSGSIADIVGIKKTIEQQQKTKEMVDETLTIGIAELLSPQLNWILRGHELSTFSEASQGVSSYQIAITGHGEIQFSRKYIGQEFTVDAYPKWLRSPIKSVFDYDYWSWLIFRISPLLKVHNYIWIAMD